MTRKKSVAALGRAPQDEFEKERAEATERSGENAEC
jgi:hypothetical protein